MLNELATSMGHVTTVLESAFKSPALPPTPVHKQDAIKAALRLEKGWLSTKQMTQLINVFEREPYAAEGYQTVLEEEEIRKQWVL